MTDFGSSKLWKGRSEKYAYIINLTSFHHILDPGLAGDLFACSEPNSRCTPRDLCADFDYDDLSNPTPVGVRQAGPDCPRADEICCVNILEEDTIVR